MMLSPLLSSGDQLGRPDVECRRQRRHRGERWSALSALDAADVVAVDAAVEAQALLGDAEFVT